MLPERKFRIISGLGLAAAALAATALGAVPARAAATLTTLYSFCAQTNCADGAEPFAGLIADAAGNLFGTTAFAGANDGGTVFEIAKTASGYAGAATTLYSFCAQTNSQGVCTDGQQPAAGLIADAAGNLFGTTQRGGANDGGTVFELAKNASGYASAATVLYSFCTQTNSQRVCTDGQQPAAGPIADATGNLFGTTFGGGAHGEGTVFELAKTASGYASTPTILYSFCAQLNCADGQRPKAGLIADAAGNLFGATQAGGAHEEGTVFELAKTASSYASAATVLYSFCAQTNCTDGATPVAGLIADGAGNLFGTTQLGGGPNNQGTVFELGGSGFVPPFAGTPGTPNCHGQSVSALARQYGGLNAAAAALGFSSVQVMQNAITGFCAG
jgi:uncharacterized repeat protein (TIGR03803 family)